MKTSVIWALCATLAVPLGGCHKDEDKPQPPTVGDGPFKPPPIVVSSDLPNVKIDGATGSLPLSSAASYGWSAFIALHWPSSPTTRGGPDTSKTFGAPGTPVWVTMRSKVEVYPGNGSATVAPHGVTLDPATHKPTNGPAYGYSDAPQYFYAAGQLSPCPGQPPVTAPAYIVLDETTQINNNQTFAGAAPAVDPSGFNTKPQLIRYALKMNQPIYANVVSNQYWYSGTGSPLATAKANYVAALNAGTGQDPTPPFVNLAPVYPDTNPNDAGIEIKSAWRALNEKEAASGRFLTTTVRSYEQPDGKTSCYREATWGLVGMHVISFSVSAPWVIWTSFEQADNILTADGKPTEDVNGNVLIPATSPTTPELSSDPNQANPTVTAKGAFCDSPGLRLYFQENPNYGTLPSAGNICVNGRWWPSEPTFVRANEEAHKVLAEYLAAHGQASSPLMYYKLVAAQGVPVDFEARNGGTFSTTTSYYSANSTIETDYSMGNFTGRLVKGVPSNLGPDGQAFNNTQLLPFQSARLGLGKMNMGGCAGCHDNGALRGQDFSFALGNNVLQPEATNAFATPNLLRNYFPGQ
jgi:hypothetical protein